MSEEPKSTTTASYVGAKSEFTHPVDVELYMGMGPLAFAESRVQAEHPDGYHIEWVALIPLGFRLSITKDGKHVATGIVHEKTLIHTLTEAMLAKAAEHNDNTKDGNGTP